MGVRLPSEYQETEWIEGTRGAQYINTGISGNDNSLVIEAKVIPGEYAAYCPLWGNFNSETANVTRLIANNNSNQILPQVNVKASGGVDAVAVRIFGTGNIFTIRQTKNSIEVNGTTYPITVRNIGTANTKPIAINASRPDPSSSGNSVQRFYYFRISNADTKLIDLIPCYRKFDSKPGMYDLVSGTFFTNAGTGEFLVGPDVIDSISPWLVARRRMLMKQPDLYPIGTDIVLKYIGLHSGSTTQKDFVIKHGYNNQGEYIERSGYAASPVYMEVDSAYLYSAKGGRIYHLCYYDKDKSFISYIVSNTTSERTLPALPAGARYARVETLDATSNWVLSITRIS